jgi:hypothetical protein
MPYITRDAAGQICAVTQTESEGSEEISAHSAELMAFIFAHESAETPQHYLQSTDLDMIRAIEDLIRVLIEKSVILMSDLPSPVQQKLKTRSSARNQLPTCPAELLIDHSRLFLM